MKSIHLIHYSISLILPFATATCYFPDGTTTQDTPCNPKSANSTCCGPGYACLSNHICAVTQYTPSDIASNSKPYVRGSCTDKSWTSPDCPLFCKNQANGDNLGMFGMSVEKCDLKGVNNRWYCDNQVTAALDEKVVCANESYYFEFDGFPSTATIIGVASTPSASVSVGGASSATLVTSSSASQSTATTSSSLLQSASSSSAPSTSAQEKQQADKADDTKTMRLGLGLGLGLGIPLLLLLAACLLFYRRNRTNNAQGLDSGYLGMPPREIDSSNVAHKPWRNQSTSDFHEANAEREVYETEGSAYQDKAVFRHELPAGK